MDGSVSDAVKEFVGTAIEDEVKRLAPNAALGAVSELGLVIFKPFAGELVVTVIKLLLGKTDRIQSLVEKQIKAPFETGTRIIHEAMRLKGADAKKAEYKSKRLSDGILKLDEAWTYAEGMPGQGAIRFHIRLLQGLAYAQIEGGEESAQEPLQECYDAIGRWIREIDGLIKTEQGKLARAMLDKPKADEAKRQRDAISDFAAGPGAAAKWGHNQRWETYQQPIDRAEQQIQKLTANKLALQKLAAIIKATGVPIIDSNV